MQDTPAKKIGFIGFNGITALDLVGPAEAFAVTCIGKERTRAYEVVVLGVGIKPFTSESGIIFYPNKSLNSAPPLDTLIVPGGSGMRDARTNLAVATWIKKSAPDIRRIASVCTGVYGLAATGLLDGKRVTTHWRFAKDIAQRFPLLKVEAEALFLKQGKYYTAAGVSAGMDLALSLIQEDHGHRVALAVARELVMYVKRSGGQNQFSEPLQFQVEATDRFSDLAGWILTHLDQDLSVETLAAKACLCPRHFSRQFKSGFGRTPAAFVEEQRVAEACRRLVSTNATIEQITTSVGFKTSDTFRRSFERALKIPPSLYRSRFKLQRAS